jgi:hypothetical protein
MIHGYSDKGKSFQTWVHKLGALGMDPAAFHICSYESLSNEVTIPDIAEGFDRALRDKAGLNGDEEFDAIVHSTGMLVIRSWLAVYAARRSRLKHLIALAPASFGSPLAHKGRSWLGGIFKGKKELGPDFLEAGDRVLDALELGSRYTWELAEKDLLGAAPCYGPERDTPYVFTFCGTEAYGGIRKWINAPGTDGTVRWAGCALNTRKIVLDLTKNCDAADRITFSRWSNVNIPLIPIEGVDHGSILAKPPDELVDRVHRALGVESRQQHTEWYADVSGSVQHRLADSKWQQFVIRATDERGDPIADYFIQLEGRRKDGCEELLQFDLDVHPYGSDSSFRNFHVNLSELKPHTLDSLALRVIASSGSPIVAYNGLADQAEQEEGVWNAALDLTGLLHDGAVKFFYPFTTTLVELKLNREPLPLSGPNKVLWFDASN